jgi:hypothetical protein
MLQGKGEKILSKWQVDTACHVEQSDTGDTAALLNTAQLFQIDNAGSPVRLCHFKLLCHTDDAGSPVRVCHFKLLFQLIMLVAQ